MRHLVFGRRLGRDTNSRKALLRNLASSLFVNGFLMTTQTKAKFAQPFVERLVTYAKKNSLAKKRAIAGVLTPQAFFKLESQIKNFAQKPGGYTRIVKLAARRGDNAPMARLEIITDSAKILTPSKEIQEVDTKQKVKNQKQKTIAAKGTKKKKKIK